MKKKSGFTLVELMITITIIGVLTSLAVVNYSTVQKKTRDSQRKLDIKQIQGALEIFRSDVQSYPGATGATGGLMVGCGVSGSPANCSYGQGWTYNSILYMSKIPKEKLYTTSAAQYSYLSNTANYTLRSCLEMTTDSEGSTDSLCPSGKGFFVVSP